MAGLFVSCSFDYALLCILDCVLIALLAFFRTFSFSSVSCFQIGGPVSFNGTFLGNSGHTELRLFTGVRNLAADWSCPDVTGWFDADRLLHVRMFVVVVVVVVVVVLLGLCVVSEMTYEEIHVCVCTLCPLPYVHVILCS
jgi:hypothetical protein